MSIPALLRIGAACSENASAIQAAHKLLRERGVEFHVVTHKPSGIETFCDRENISRLRIEEAGKEQFSLRARDWLAAQDVDFAVLFLDRLLSRTFVESIFTVNFHPALLPAFPGVGAIERALAAGTAYIGATAHQATIDTDAGPIIAQSCYALGTDDRNMARLLDISFVQRLALLCDIVDSQLIDRGTKRGWLVRGPSGSSRGSDFVSPTWLCERSKALIGEQARQRQMQITI